MKLPRLFLLVWVCLCLGACAKTPALEPGILESAAEANQAARTQSAAPERQTAEESGESEGQYSESAGEAEAQYSESAGESEEQNSESAGEVEAQYSESAGESEEQNSESAGEGENVEQSGGTSGGTENGAAAQAGQSAAEGRTPKRIGQGKTELIVFACSSLRETLEEIAKQYREQNPAVTPRFRFDGSGALLEQLKEGAYCDLFLAAAPAVMDALDPSRALSNPDGLPLIDPDSRVNLLENQMVLAVPLNNPANIHSFDQLSHRFGNGKVLLAIAGAGEPEGRYAQAVLNAFQIGDRSVKTALCAYDSETAARVSEGMADCGIFFATERGSFLVMEAAEKSGAIVYPAAVLAESKAPEAARAFLSYLTGAEAGAMFAWAGFTHLPTLPAAEISPENAAEAGEA